MNPGTARIILWIVPHNDPVWLVEWFNFGSFLQNQPRAFRTEADARQFCRQRSLRVVS